VGLYCKIAPQILVSSEGSSVGSVSEQASDKRGCCYDRGEQDRPSAKLTTPNVAPLRLANEAGG